MGQLLKKPKTKVLKEGVTLVHDTEAEKAPLKYVSFKLVDIQANAIYEETLGSYECCIVVVRGTVTVTDGEHVFSNIGTRSSVFERKPTDSVYLSNGRSFTVTGTSEACIALCYAPSNKQLPTKLIKASDVGIENRGQLQNKRLVHNILPDSDKTANSLLVVEVFTESGNWSSYPPHKHDEDNLPYESFLEETYYHEIDPPQGFVFQRVYTESRNIDETMAVENGDVVIVPAGYHPVGVPDGYASYYLNVMAGPVRIWKFRNEKDHEWILSR
ncbi:5-deoxy-glucuronate isomerase [Shouchella clausii]|uniref:5-deoxy-glucuronate isomerase n=1 Tax=Shouchella clausii TaxID=79880 RepID=A0A268NVN6_SHOCL|nr:5-deoxy-glucuronate isomerase [Shouchella clausii]PAE87534.1 5-deoxy-glucuronate isomerase [Shouchella clausii]